MKITRFLGLCASMIALAACSNDKSNDVDNPADSVSIYEEPAVEVVDGKVSLSRNEMEVGETMEKFSYDFFGTIAQNAQGENALFSPICAWMTLSMAANASAGNTYAQLANAMGCSELDLDLVNDYNYKVMKALPSIDENVDLRIANAFFSKAHVDVKESFKSRLDKVYGAEIFTLGNSIEEVANAINAWVSDKTSSKIKELLIKEEVVELNFALLDAIYFNAPWQTEFNESNRKLSFHNYDGSIKEVNPIGALYPYKCCEVDGIRFMEIPFAGGWNFAAYNITFALPTGSKTPADALNLISKNGLQTILENAQNDRAYIVELPKFSDEESIDLIDVLKQKGVTDMFEFGKCDFSKMTDYPLLIRLVKEKSTFEIDETGACGASGSILGGFESSTGEAVEIPTFTVDRPFLYIVSEKSTNAVIFIGVINKL